LWAYLILKEEYPLVHPFIKKETNKETYLLKCNVNNLKAIVRFLLRLPKDDEVIGCKEFKNYLNYTK
jgi:hypothetical protein